MASNSNLVISISARDQASGAFRKIKLSLGELERASSEAGEAGDALGKIFASGLGQVAGGVAGFFAVGQLASATLELGKLGAQAERTRTAYGEMAATAGQSAAAMLRAMREATAGTVSDSTLMLNANRAMTLGVADNARELSQLMAAAIERGRALGISSQQAINDIITGIGRMSPMILDNLGIVGVTKSVEQYAASLGKTADKLTDVERKQALVNAVIAQSPGAAVANDAAAAFERMDASLQNAREALGTLFGPAVAVVADQIASAAMAAADALNTEGISAKTAQLAEYQARLAEILDQLAVLERTRETLATQPAFAPPELQSVTPADIDALQQSAQETAKLIYQLQLQIAEMQGLAEQTVRTREEQLAYNQSLWDGQASWSAFQSAAQIAAQQVHDSMTRIMAQAQGSLASIAQGIAASQGDQAGLDWLATMNRLVEEQISLWAAEGRTIEQITGVLLPTYITKIRSVADAAQKTGTAITDIGQRAQEASSASDIAWRRFIAGLAAVERRAAVTRDALARVADAVVSAQRGPKFPGRSQDSNRLNELNDIGERLSRGLDRLYDTTYSGGGGGGIIAVADEFDNLTSSVQGVIDAARRLDIGGLNPADFLPREDAINENARRLAAIMRDGLGNQEWMDEFAAEVPGIFDEIASSGDPRAAAARILQEFQDGLRPELLDRDQIKNRVRQMILGNQSSAQLASEIAGELATELGISLGQAQAAVQGVIGLGTERLSTPTNAGPDGAAQAETFATAWARKIQDNTDIFEVSGRTAGTSFGVGFIAVQHAYIDQWAQALVGLVTGGVIANLAAQASRTGAR